MHIVPNCIWSNKIFQTDTNLICEINVRRKNKYAWSFCYFAHLFYTQLKASARAIRDNCFKYIHFWYIEMIHQNWMKMRRFQPTFAQIRVKLLDKTFFFHLAHILLQKFSIHCVNIEFQKISSVVSDEIVCDS